MRLLHQRLYPISAALSFQQMSSEASISWQHNFAQFNGFFGGSPRKFNIKTALDGMAAVPKRAEHTHTLTGAPFEDSIWQ